MKIVVTSGERWVDIDAVACAVAYKELLELQGREAVAVFPGPLNHSVSPMAQALGLEYVTACPDDVAGFVLVDISDPEYFAKCVDLQKVVEVYDHHAGFETYWSDQLQHHAHIEMIGACATLIWEAYVRAGFADRISGRSATLLAMAIVSNSLNFNLPITSDRDRKAFEALKPFITLPNDWVTQYYAEQERTVFQDLEGTLKNDTKMVFIPALRERLVIGQLELWDPRQFLGERREELAVKLAGMGEGRWMLNLPSLSEGRNYIFTTDFATQELLTKAFGWQFENGIALTDGLFLRKMILKALLPSA